MKYSVIIPIYNAAKTLHRCLNSLVPQLREDTELLLVDDGSTDASAEICADYAANCPQIRIFSKQNGGVSSARNLGLDHAQGEYVLFVDSDDAVNPGYFDVLESALKDQPELLMFGVQVFRGAQCTCRHPCEKQTMIEGSACASALSTAMRRQKFNLITTKAFRRDIIQVNQIRFEESLDIGEDKVSPLPTRFASRMFAAFRTFFIGFIWIEASLSPERHVMICLPAFFWSMMFCLIYLERPIWQSKTKQSITKLSNILSIAALILSAEKSRLDATQIIRKMKVLCVCCACIR